MNLLQRLRTFPRGLWWVGFCSFFGTCGLGAVLVFVSTAWCNALEHYKITTISELMRGLLMTLVYAPLIFWLGIKAYRLFRGRWPLLLTTKGTLGYFIVLAFAVFPFQFLRIPVNIRNHRIEHSICTKSTSDGMFTESKGLTTEEYAHLQQMLSLLPDLPAEPDSINVLYYSDGFLPVFGIKIRCAVARASQSGYPLYVPMTKDGPSGWMSDTTSTDPRVAWLVYEDGES